MSLLFRKCSVFFQNLTFTYFNYCMFPLRSLECILAGQEFCLFSSLLYHQCWKSHQHIVGGQ
jgi:hypothetical protein